jgi:hypothetical protein
MCFLFANESSHVLEATKKKTHRGESFVTLVVAKMQRSLCLLQMQTLIWPDQPVEAAAADDDGGRNHCLDRTLQYHVGQRPARDAEEDQRRDGVKRYAKRTGQVGLSPAEDKQPENSGEGVERHRRAREDQDLFEGGRPEKRQCDP